MIDASVEAEMRSQFGESARTLGARKGPFYVLVGAHMPAVLVECGFLSNREEAVRLASPDYQQGLALGIADAVIDFLDSATAVGNL
jgi:N-acetylmuramoyl-L-alanine amidase